MERLTILTKNADPDCTGEKGEEEEEEGGGEEEDHRASRLPLHPSQVRTP
jgi:hypothetical protein